MTALHLKRKWLTPNTTIGELFFDGVFECFILEDRYRAPGKKKVYGETAIPCGVFPIVITHSPRFNRLLPLVDAVPGFEGVRIHPGNTKDDTEGCLLPGRKRSVDRVDESKLAFEALYAKLVKAQAKGKIALTVSIEP